MGIVEDLQDARARTLGLVLDLDDAQWMGPRMGPRLDIVNPMLWEIGHVAWFQEHWTLRHVRKQLPIRHDGDRLYDSAKVAHDTRWDLPLPDRRGTLAYLQEILERCIACACDGHDPYFHELALYHEDMHGEALAYTRQTLSHPAPPGDATAVMSGGPLPGDALVPGGRYELGARPADGFAFDNEKWAHPVRVQPFRIARAPVTNEELAKFVADRGYQRRDLWSDEGWAWRTAADANRPLDWRDGAFEVRRYDRVAPLAPHQPAIHVGWFEAEAYCRWAKRRLPTEAEWELAASGFEKRRFPWGDEPPTPEHARLDGRHGGVADVGAFPLGDSPYGCRQMLGNVWEWTASDFEPYPGFVIDPYKEYSEPWFHSPHKVLRGGSWATRGRLLRNTWRNFYPPERRDVFAGFRTCAID